MFTFMKKSNNDFGILTIIDCREVQPIHSEGDQPWDFFGRNDAKAETPVLWPPHELTHWKRLWCWEGLRAGEGDDRGWDGWMASWTRWTWVWVNSGRWWWTGRPGVLRLIHGVAKSWTRLSDWTELLLIINGLWLCPHKNGDILHLELLLSAF